MHPKVVNKSRIDCLQVVKQAILCSNRKKTCGGEIRRKRGGLREKEDEREGGVGQKRIEEKEGVRTRKRFT